MFGVMTTEDRLTEAQRRALDKIEKEVDWDRLNEISVELHSESDRAAVVLGAAWLDEGMRELLRAFLLPARESKPENDEVLKFSGPLGSYFARCEMSFRLGLIGEDFRKALLQVATIRNKFAHVVGKLDLNKPPFTALIGELPDIIPSKTFWREYLKKYYRSERTPRTMLRSKLALMATSLFSASRTFDARLGNRSSQGNRCRQGPAFPRSPS